MALTNQTGIPIARYTVGADSQVTNTASETAHTALTLISTDINTARRVVRFCARLFCDSDNAGDTLTLRVRLGAAGVGGTVVFTSTTFDAVANDSYILEGEIMIRTVGGGGTFYSYARLWNETGADTISFSSVAAGAVDTTLARDLTVTSTWSAAAGADQVTLRSFWAEVMSA